LVVVFEWSIPRATLAPCKKRVEAREGRKALEFQGRKKRSSGRRRANPAVQRLHCRKDSPGHGYKGVKWGRRDY